MNAHASLSTDELRLWTAIKYLSETAFGAVARTIEAATGLSRADHGSLTRIKDLGGGVLGQATLLTSLVGKRVACRDS